MRKNPTNLENIASEIRYNMLQVLRPGESHHIGCSFSIVEIVTLLYFRILKVNHKKPASPDRDIFILSKGHAALAVYAALYKKGFFSRKIFASYDQDGGLLPEHISKNVPGIEFSSGSLGHGLPVGVGFATSFLNDNKKNQVFVLMSDGEFDEGSNWEAIMFAAHHRLSNLTAIVDLNGLQGYAPTKKVIDLSPLAEKIRAFGWQVVECDGHDFKSLEKAFFLINRRTENRNRKTEISDHLSSGFRFQSSDFSKKPTMILAKTVKGSGVPYFEGKFESHYQSISDEKTKKKIINQFLNKK